MGTGGRLSRLALGWARTLLGVGLATGLLLRSAHAQSSPAGAATAGVSTQLDPCVPVDPVRFHRVLAIELGTAIAYSEFSEADRALTAVSVTCDAEGILLLLEDGVTRKNMTRVIDLNGVDIAARSRLLALTVAEFVVASWLELRLVQPAPLSPVAAAPAREVERSASARAQAALPAPPAQSRAGGNDWQLGAAFSLMAFSSALHPIAGAELQLRLRLTAAIWFLAGVQLGRGALDAELEAERVEAQLTATSASFSALYTARASSFELSGGLGGRIGVVRLAGGRTSNAAFAAISSYAPWAGPIGSVCLAYRAGPHLRIEAKLEVGIVVQGARALADELTVLWLKDGWGGAALGLAWAF